jgi:hypothetical protein
MFYILKEPEGKTYHMNIAQIACIETRPSSGSGLSVGIMFSGGENIQVTMSESEWDRFVRAVENHRTPPS